MVYYQDFNEFANTASYEEILKTLGWKALFRNPEGVPAGWEDFSLVGINGENFDLCGATNDCTAIMSIKDGRLYVENHHTADGSKALNNNNNGSGQDSYWQMLSHSYMELADRGNYTIQYEIEYDDWANPTRYGAIVTGYMHKEIGYPAYYSAHLRVTAKMDHETRLEQAMWNNMCKGATIAGDIMDGSMSIAERIFGVAYSADGTPAGKKKIVITTLYVHDPEFSMEIPEYSVTLKEGYHIFIDGKLATMTYIEGEMAFCWGDKDLMPSSAVALKAGGQIDFFIDNIMVWTGASLTPPTDKSTTAYAELVKSAAEAE